MDAKAYYEWYNREDPLSGYRPEDEVTFAQRLAWFSKSMLPGRRVLDYGCGEGVLLAGLREGGIANAESCGVDISKNAVKKAAARFPGLCFSATRPDGAADFPAASFDAVVATEVIERVFDTDAVFREFHRLLRPEGLLLLSCPYHGFLKDLALLVTGGMERHYRDPYSCHIRYYSRNALRGVHQKTDFPS